MKNSQKVLQLTAHFRPNIGGVETHLDDLVKALIKREWSVIVLTYRPLTTGAKWQMFEKNEATIIRIPWLPNLFYKFVHLPILEFVYLLPGLFISTPIVLFFSNPDVMHAHGLVAGFVGVFWGKLFSKRVVVSTHSIYHFPKKGLYKDFVSWIFNKADYCLGLSKQATEEIRSLGVSLQKSGDFTYWVDLDKFKVRDSKLKVREQLGWEDKFTVLFVGRLVEEKGINELIESVKGWNKGMVLRIIGSGPLEEKVKNAAYKYKNTGFIGVIGQDKLPLYYSGADVLIVPSTSEEGFGRVILEALACGLPVVAANRGGIVEAIDKTVGKLIEINPENIKNSVEYFYSNKGDLKKMSLACRSFAERRYSDANVETIIKSYSK